MRSTSSSGSLVWLMLRGGRGQGSDFVMNGRKAFTCARSVEKYCSFCFCTSAVVLYGMWTIAYVNDSCCVVPETAGIE
eukprot:209484-Rhodomonas_salina.4